MCDNTNRNSENNITAGKKFIWTPVTPEKMGLVFKLPKVSDMLHVKSIFNLPFPMGMSRHRFLFISWNMHMSEPEEDAVNDKKKGRLHPQKQADKVGDKTFLF